MLRKIFSSKNSSEVKRRGYQQDFHDTCARVRDPASRLEIAHKLSFILDGILDCDTRQMTGLDIGCSSGFVTDALAPRFARLIGLDIDQRALQREESHLEKVAEYVEGDAMLLPFETSAFDFIFCLQVYEHVPDDEILAQEIFRVLKPEGIVLFSGPNLLFPVEPHYQLPLLHWLPPAWADVYLQKTGRGSSYYEKSRSYWGLRGILHKFTIQDISHEVAIYRLLRGSRITNSRHPIIRPAKWLLRPTIPLFPNFNWILRKNLQHTINDNQ